MNCIPIPITFHSHFENFSLPLTFISQIEGLQFLVLGTLLSCSGWFQPSKLHATCLIKRQASEFADSKKRPLQKHHPGKGRRIREKRSSKASGVEKLRGERTERRRTEVRNIEVGKEWVRRTCRFYNVSDIHRVATNVFLVCHIDILPSLGGRSRDG